MTTSRRRGPAVARRQLGLRIRRARSAKDQTQGEVAAALEWSTSKLLRIENGQVGVSTADIQAVFRYFGSEHLGDEEPLVELARDGRQATVSSTYRDALSAAFADWLEHEAYAVEIRQYETKLVPGVLQTGAYAQAVVQALQSEDDEREPSRIVEARTARAAGLIGSDGPRMSFIVDEAALRRGVGHEGGEEYDYALMIEQLNYLKKMNTRGRVARGEKIEPDLNPDIGIQIVPFEVGAYVAMRGPFELLEFEEPEDDNMVYFENPDGDVVVRDSSDRTAPYLDMFTEMQRTLDDYTSFDTLIDEIITFMEQGRNGLPAPRRPRPVHDPASA